jgi:PAS domain S-box-containing protein
MDVLWIGTPGRGQRPRLAPHLRVEPLVDVPIVVHRGDGPTARTGPRPPAPDAVVLDVAGLTPEEAARRVGELAREMAVPVLTAGGGEDPRLLLETAAAGAAAHLPAATPPQSAAALVLLAVERGRVESELLRGHATGHELDATRQQYRTLFEHNPLPTVVIDVDRFRFVAANRAAIEATGYPRAELLRLDPNELLSDSDTDPRAVRELLAGEDQVGPVRIRLRHRNGHRLQGELHTAALDYGGRRARLLLLRDIGDEVRLEEAFGRAWSAVAVHEATSELAQALGGLVERLGDHLAALRPALAPGSPPAREVDGIAAAARRIAEVRRRLEELAAANRAAPRPAAPGGAAVLLVDDDAAVRFLMREMLEEAGHRVVPCASGEEAVAAAAEGPFDVVVADATLPDLPGDRLLERLRRHAPYLRALFVSGYLDETLAARGVLGPHVPFLAKPFSADELRAKVAELLSDPGPTASG